MNNKIIGLVVLIIIAGIAGFYYYAPKTADDSGSAGSSMPVPEVGNQTPDTAVEKTVAKEFVIDGKDFSFAPATMTVSKGEWVKITLKNTQGFHDLRIEGYDIGTEKIQAGNESSFEFLADKVGTFTYYCSVGSHRQKGMVGTFVVK